MAGSERIAVLKALSTLINAVDAEYYNDGYSDETLNVLGQLSEQLWFLHQEIVLAELNERIAVTKTKTKQLTTLAGKLSSKESDLREVATKIKKVAKAVDHLVDITKKSIELAAKVADII